jgi:competence protein ComEA
MSFLQSVAIKFAMLAVTVGILYWALQTDAPVLLKEVQAPPAAASRPQPAEDPPSRPVEAESVAPAKPSPARKQAAPLPTRRPVSFPIDLNKASRQEFLELPGIGEKLADRILQYRKEHGRFRSVEELREVPGIGKKRMERLRPLIIAARKS